MPPKNPLQFSPWYLLILLLIALLLFKWGYLTGTASFMGALTELDCRSAEPESFDETLNIIKTWTIEGRTPTKIKTTVYWGQYYMHYADTPKCADFMEDKLFNAQSAGSETVTDKKFGQEIYIIDNLYYWCFQDKMLIVSNSQPFQEKYFNEFFICQ